eukprot:g35573.t1
MTMDVGYVWQVPVVMLVRFVQHGIRLEQAGNSTELAFSLVSMSGFPDVLIVDVLCPRAIIVKFEELDIQITNIDPTGIQHW